MDIDELDDDDEWIAVEDEIPRGQSQLEMLNLMLGTEDVHFIGLVPKHRSHRVLIETLEDEATCPVCGTSAVLAGRPVRDIVDPEPYFGKVVIFEWHVRRWRCPNPECSTDTFEDELPPVGSARNAKRRKQ
jgi:transposase